MRAKRRQSGVTLTEMAVVIAVAALLAALGLPAIRTFFNSLATEGGTKAMIGAALSSARAIAAERQRYAGVRFQKAYHPAGPLKASQYMIFIINDPAPKPDGTDLANGFRAVEGIQPVKLPENLGVMDLRRRLNSNPEYSGDDIIDDDTEITPVTLWDTTAFSIIFSPSGKLVIHDVRVRNRNGRTSGESTVSYDDIFNTYNQLTNSIRPFGMFLQDDYAVDSAYNFGLGQESSRNYFIIYERDKFRQALGKYQPYSGYLYKLEPVYINPYTGTIVNR